MYNIYIYIYSYSSKSISCVPEKKLFFMYVRPHHGHILIGRLLHLFEML